GVDPAAHGHLTTGVGRAQLTAVVGTKAHRWSSLPLGEVLDQFVPGEALLPGVGPKVADGHDARLQLVAADDDREAGLGAVGRLDLALHRAVGEPAIGADPGPAQLGGDVACLGPAGQVDHVGGDARLGHREHAFVVARQQHPFDAGAEADAG